MTNKKFHLLFGREPRKVSDAIEQFHMDIAALYNMLSKL